MALALGIKRTERAEQRDENIVCSEAKNVDMDMQKKTSETSNEESRKNRQIIRKLEFKARDER